jgi:hypothetical protein
VFDPPETPAPVFAIRAFKSALFGTPGAEDDDDEGLPCTRRRKSKRAQNLLDDARDNNEKPLQNGRDRLINIEKRQSMPSPTKSILMTPGTTAMRRKTVSFGEGVVESERNMTKAAQFTSGLPQNFPGKFPSPWSTRKSDAQPVGKSKLTQSLLNARDQKTEDRIIEDLLPEAEEKDLVTALPPVISTLGTAPAKELDETVNLDEPRSKSGRYWKSEYEQFESKSNREIRKLLEYRHIAKSYAKKKDEEASRLTEKLRKQEEKVQFMEREVAEMAAKMAGDTHDGDPGVDGEEIVKKLAKQTALTVQYKQKVDKLREELDVLNVLGNGSDELIVGGDASAQRFRETEKELRNAREKISELTAENGEMRKLQVLAEATESKVSALARENEALKASLTRVKEEMSKFDDRRKAKEEKLKQRESRLESRLERMKKDRLDSEKKLREKFDDEKTVLLAQIRELQGFRNDQGDAFSKASKTDFEPPESRNIDIWALPQKSPLRDQARDPLIDIWTTHGEELDLPMEDISDGQGDMWKRATLDTTSALNSVYDRPQATKQTQIPPSSPPILPSAELSLLATNNMAAGTRRATYSPRPSMVNITGSAKFSTRHTQPKRVNLLTGSVRIDSSSNNSMVQAKRTASGELKRALPTDRIAAARARLEEKNKQRRLKEQGKENVI